MVTRRNLLSGGAGTLAVLGLPAFASGQTFVDASAFGLEGTTGNQTPALQAAIDAATGAQQPLLLGSGTFEISNATVSGPLTIRGSGRTVLRLQAGGTILSVANCSHVLLEGLTFEGTEQSGMESALLDLVGASHIVVGDCRFINAAGVGIRAHDVQGRIENCELSDIADTGIFSTDSRGMDVQGNTITRCGNGGIRIWRSDSGSDTSRVFGNRISAIDWVGGGNGQNGNGVNIFRADGVSITDNYIADCAFSAIRLNATNDTRVTGNHCANSGEVSIFSEFGFSGSIISDNLVEGGAAGISMTNFDHNGRLSICKGNIVRNLAPRSLTNPDVSPYGIAAEADAVVVGNIIEAVPGTGIVVGWGPYLRDVLVSDNLVRDCDLGIAVSVVAGAGHARIAGNVVSGSRQHAIVGTEWKDIVTADLAADAGDHASVAIQGNSVL